MDNITNIKIDANKLTFEVDYAESLTDYKLVLYVDEVWNLNNILHDSPAHNYKFTNVTGPDEQGIYTVTDDQVLLLDDNMKYFILTCTKDDQQIRFYGIYYNPTLIYHAEIRKLHSYCQTCLDDRTMQDIMLIVFKRQLLESALTGQHYKDAMQLYADICRLLDISTRKDLDFIRYNSNCCACDKCSTCCNGVCKLN